MIDAVNQTMTHIAAEILSVFPLATFTEAMPGLVSVPIGTTYRLELVGSPSELAKNRGHEGINLDLYRMPSRQRILYAAVPLVLDPKQLFYGSWQQNLRDWLVLARKQILTETQEVLDACACTLSEQAVKPMGPSEIPRLGSLSELVEDARMVVVMGKCGSGKSTFVREIIKDLREHSGTPITIWSGEETPLGIVKKLITEMKNDSLENIRVVGHPEGFDILTSNWDEAFTDPPKENEILVLMGPIVTREISWEKLLELFLKRNIKVIMEWQQARAFTKNPVPQGMDRIADLIIQVDGLNKPLNVLKNRNGYQGPMWRPVTIQKI